MPPWGRLLAGGLAAGFFAVALLAVAPLPTSAPSAAAADEACTVLGALGELDPASAASVTAELFEAANATDDGDTQPVAPIARRVIDCVLAAEKPPATETEINAAVCEIAGALNEEQEFEAALAMIDALRTARDDNKLCLDEHTAASEGVRPTVDAKGLGELWTTFQTDVVKPLAPIVTFVSLAAIALIAVARLLVLFGLFSDRETWNWQRELAGVLGVVLAIGTPTLFATRAMWFGDRGDSGTPVDPDYSTFVAQLLNWAWGWWVLYLSLAVAAVVLLAYWWATKPRMTISITSKNDGSGLDATRLMTTIDAMAGRPNSGIEFPVGTDIVDQAKAISEVSQNNFVAALQSLVKLVFGTSPWQLKVENETDGAVSMAISRNGRVTIARRLDVNGSRLKDIPEPSQPGRLAALVAGEVISEMARAYRSIRPGLNGASEPTSIAYQYVATTALESTPELRQAAVPLLHDALNDDPNNRGAAATLANFIYRDPSSVDVDHRGYRAFLEGAIDSELRQLAAGRWLSIVRARVAWYVREALYSEVPFPALPTGTVRISIGRLRRNDLLIRLLQMHTVASRNLAASTPDSLGDAPLSPYEALWLYLNARSKRGNASRTLYARRRQLFLIDRFRELDWTPGTGTSRRPDLLQDGFRGRERRAWAAALPEPDGADKHLADRFACEAAVLRVWGDFDQDPDVTYTLACHRATTWL
ncbi:hypothetical protein GCM10017608_16040 [Agromyces luteolus]|uniref:Uncharacterized protein n=1 Tax=Agromyces luteolus TaxID=88373 RepID=A0A7C9LEC0_9MICO|nr:hypothetical protein [Agromyces luteolus]MUN06910.1 hypothetical protein [Agromyces luteolus]GLK27670.1 hypothetical protein GCM10017608_16040 [Agromyces luteolus]